MLSGVRLRRVGGASRLITDRFKGLYARKRFGPISHLLSRLTATKVRRSHLQQLSRYPDHSAFVVLDNIEEQPRRESAPPYS